MDVVSLLTVVLIVALALFAIIKLGGLSGGRCQNICPKLQEKSRDLWKEHGDLTREFARRYLADDPRAPAILDRLMHNQEKIGDFVEDLAPGSGGNLTALLREHIAGAGAILADLKGCRDATSSIAAWRDNGRRLSRALSRALALPYDAVAQMMERHLDTTLNMVTLHIQGRHLAEKEAVREVMEHLQMMADAMVSKSKCMC